METELGKIIKSTVNEILSKMGFKGEVDVSNETKEDKEILTCNIKTDESNFLIGQYGVNLQALQHLARVLVRKKTDERANFMVDVNSYRQEKNNSISQLAAAMAEQAMREKRAVVLRPMSPYERRIVHLELSHHPQIETESIGEGENRKVVIKPKELI